MCGILGIISPNKNDINLSELKDTMNSRGPDDFRTSTGNFHDKIIDMYVSRLAIIDLNVRSSQPFSKFNKILIFNGEIYNYLEVKEKLISKYKFFTESDTEVLLTAYEEWGLDCVKHFEGMWSFAIFDKRKNQLILSRDRFGEKPLYLYKKNNTLIFGSELKYFKHFFKEGLSLDNNKIINFNILGYRSVCSNTDTFFKDIKSFPKGEIWSFDKDLNILKKRKYWTLDFKPNTKINLQDAVDKVEELLINSIKLRLRSDVNIGISLSGGIDSGLIGTIISKKFNLSLDTFSIVDEDERYNEEKNINSIIQNNNFGTNYKVKLETKNFVNGLKDLITYHSAPVITITSYINSLIAKEFKKTSNKVALSGIAGDELFLGYYSHYLYWLLENQKDKNFKKLKSDWFQITGSHVENPLIKDLDNFLENPSKNHLFNDITFFSSLIKKNSPISNFEDQNLSKSPLRNRMMNDLFSDVVPLVLYQEDLNYMKNSIENRCPFLDSKLTNFAYSIPNKLLVKNGYTKSILREIGKKYLPEEVNFDSRKRGFNASILSLFNINKKENLEFCLDKSKIFEFMNKEKVEELLTKKNFKSNSFSKFLFSFISTKIFLENF